MRKYSLFLITLLIMVSCQEQGIKKLENGVLIHLKQKAENGAQVLRVLVVTDKIIHVSASAERKLSEDTSLMVEKKQRDSVKWEMKEQNDTLIITTNSLMVKINTASGTVDYFDNYGKPILTEVKGGGKTFKPTEANDKPFWEVNQVFESPSDEAFYGLGQHQNTMMNYKGKDVELFQYNSKVSIPFVVSNKNYGILWDNYSLSKFGDTRDYQPLSALKLYDNEGKEGGLTAIYRSASDTNKVFVKRTESQIAYEFLSDLKNFPAMFPMGQGIVKWEGSLQSDSTGVHKFRFYNAGYAKVWLNGKLVVDKWRQAWNPTSAYFTLQMEKGQKYPIVIDWNPDGGESYIGLRCLTPLPNGKQEKLSLYSEIANQIDYYFIKGNNIDDVISGYRNVTGKSPIMPKWAMGFWQSRERYKTQAELLSVVEEYRKRQIPIDNIVMDWFYWPEDKWGDHNFDSTRFPNPTEMISQLHNKLNVHFMISVWPKFYEGTENYKTLDDKGYLYKKNILDKQKDWVGPGYVSTFYDAYNADARGVFWDMMNKKLFSKGVDAWWLDASEPDIHSNRNIQDRKALMNPTAIGPSAQYFNAFPFVNAKGIYEGQRHTNPDQRVFILTRSAYAGQQRFAAATWSGDIGARWDEMKTQISAGLNFSISGIPYWTMDIGGFAVEKKFEQAKDELLEEWREQMTRWYEFGAFTPIFRVHGQFPFREIFNVSTDNHPTYKAMVDFDKLRYKLMPYIYTMAGMTYFNDYTIMRALVMDFTSDSNTYDINDQYMFGPSLLVNPICTYKARKRDVYLPKGTGWYDLFNGKYYQGGQIISAEAPISQIPVYVKEGAIIPVGPEIQYAEQPSDEPFTLLIYKGKDGNFEIYEDENNNYNYEKGKFSVIPLSYSEEKGELTIGTRKGEFDGLQKSRNFKVILVSKNKPENINSSKGELVNYSGQEIKVKLQI